MLFGHSFNIPNIHFKQPSLHGRQNDIMCLFDEEIKPKDFSSFHRKRCIDIKYTRVSVPYVSTKNFPKVFLIFFLTISRLVLLRKRAMPVAVCRTSWLHIQSSSKINYQLQFGLLRHVVMTFIQRHVVMTFIQRDVLNVCLVSIITRFCWVNKTST